MRTVLLCAYDEQGVIAPTLRAVGDAMRGLDGEFRIVLVDDGSRDATVAEAEQTAREHALPLRVIRHEHNQGLGAALKTGFEACLADAAADDVIITLDADNTHPPRLIPRLLAKLDGDVELVIASRYQPGALVHGVPAERRLLSGLGRGLLQAAFPMPGVRDYTCCYRAYRAGALMRARRAFGDRLASARGFEAVMDLLLRLRAVGVRAVEVPLELEYESRVGRSKMRVLATIRSTLALLARRFVERFTTDSPRRVRERLSSLEESRA